jgi:CRISPR-associated DxTHG motif protein
MSKLYTFSDYDKHMSLKLDFDMWLIIAYFLRPFILKVSTIQMGRGAKSASVSGLKELVYPNDFGFFIAFLATLPVIVLIIVYVKRKPGASGLVRKLWHNGRALLIVTAVLNIIIIFIPFLLDLTHSINMLGWAQLAIAVFIIYHLYTAQRVKDTFADFPKDEPETDAK